ncbi:hypothetical protein BKA65DRAFT_542871 [Rhexocercosporidium sp. MPI-PUGE-AT-0058]|nr:hypothetical protein BKA65DRAFT_542871 [Rhexocercosporidium sp. MPI-PUGE-AT-0058]
MQLHFALNFGIATLLGVIFSAVSYPVVETPSAQHYRAVPPHSLLSRVPAAFPVPPGVKPPPPRKPEKPAGQKGGDLIPGGSGPAYEPRPEYGRYLDKGKTLQQNFKDRQITDPDIDHNYATDIQSYTGYDRPTVTVSDVEPVSMSRAEGAPPIDFKLEGSWMRYKIIASSQDQPAAIFYHSSSQKTAVLSELFNSRVGNSYGVSLTKVKWSEMLFQTWAREAGARTSELKYITYGSVSPGDLREVVDAARKLKDMDKVEYGGWVSFSKDADSRADRDAFAALVGMDTTRTAYNMVTDHKAAFRGISPQVVHTYSEGKTGGSARHIVIELG